MAKGVMTVRAETDPSRYVHHQRAGGAAAARSTVTIDASSRTSSCAVWIRAMPS
jgi:hypothetical protein